MGLSASQCRYLMLAARKSDVEFRGQQINQQRTTLANESSNIYAELIEMDVPTAPSSSDYTTTAYTFTMGSMECDVSTVAYDAANNATYNGELYPYDVTVSYDMTGAQATQGDAIYTRDDAGNYYKGASIDTATSLSNVADLDPDSPEYISASAALTECYGEDWDTVGEEYYYTIGNNDEYQFVTGTQMESLNDGVAGADSGHLTYLYVDEDASITASETLQNCQINWSDSGRMESIEYYDEATDTVSTYTVTCTTSTDEFAYNDAYNEYEYQQQVYDNKQNSINAQLDIVQTQDKTLELELENLDSTQSAIATEMESVSKVIDKNIEKTFNAFA